MSTTTVIRTGNTVRVVISCDCEPVPPTSEFEMDFSDPDNSQYLIFLEDI